MITLVILFSLKVCKFRVHFLKNSEFIIKIGILSGESHNCPYFKENLLDLHTLKYIQIILYLFHILYITLIVDTLFTLHSQK